MAAHKEFGFFFSIKFLSLYIYHFSSLCVFSIQIKNPFYIFFFFKKTAWASFSVISHLYHLNTTRCGKDWLLMVKTRYGNSAYNVVHFIMLISLCLFLFIDSCYYPLFSLVLCTLLRKVIFLGHLVSRVDILGGAGKVQDSFSESVGISGHTVSLYLTHLILPGM